jgi:myosin heavy subunit
MQADPTVYTFARAGGNVKVPSVNDKQDFVEVQQALASIGMNPAQQDTYWSVVAGVLHLGNITFAADANGNASVTNQAALAATAAALSVDSTHLAAALTKRVLAARGQVVLFIFPFYLFIDIYSTIYVSW